VPEQGVHEGVKQFGDQGVVVEEKVPEGWWEAQSEVSDGGVPEDVVGEEGTAITHPADKAVWTPSPSFAREWNGPPVSAVRAKHLRVPDVEVLALDELLELPHDERLEGAAFLVAESDEGPNVVVDDLMEERDVRPRGGIVRRMTLLLGAVVHDRPQRLLTGRRSSEGWDVRSDRDWPRAREKGKGRSLRMFEKHGLMHPGAGKCVMRLPPGLLIGRSLSGFLSDQRGPFRPRAPIESSSIVVGRVRLLEVFQARLVSGPSDRG